MIFKLKLGTVVSSSCGDPEFDRMVHLDNIPPDCKVETKGGPKILNVCPTRNFGRLCPPPSRDGSAEGRRQGIVGGGWSFNRRHHPRIEGDCFQWGSVFRVQGLGLRVKG